MKYICTVLFLSGIQTPVNIDSYNTVLYIVSGGDIRPPVQEKSDDGTVTAAGSQIEGGLSIL